MTQTAPPEVVNARMACVGNGVTDDTTALQSLLNAGGDIYLPAGATFLVTSLNIPVSGTRLRGPGQLLWSSAATNLHLLTIPANSVGITIDGIEIDGSLAGGRAALAVAVSGPTSTLHIETFLGAWPVGTQITLGYGTANQETVTVASGSTNTELQLSANTTKTHAVGDMILWYPGEAISISGFRHELRDIVIRDVPGGGILVNGKGVITTTLSASATAGSQTIQVANGSSFVEGQPIVIASALGSASTTLSSNISANATSVPLASSTGFAPGQTILIGPGTANMEQATVQAVSGSTLIVAHPLTFSHNSGAGVMAVTYESADVQTVTSTSITLKMPTWFAHNSGDVVVQTGVQHIGIRGCQIYNTTFGGVAVSDTLADGSDAPTDCIIEGCETDTTGFAGISISGRRILVQGNSVRNAGYIPPHQDGITAYNHTNEDLVIDENTIYITGNNGIHAGGNRISIINNTLTSVNPIATEETGIIVQSDPNTGPAYSFDCVVSNNRLVDIRTGTGIQVNGYAGVVISGNEIRDVLDSGIGVGENGGVNMEVADSVVVVANTVRNVKSNDGIRLGGVRRVAVSGNAISECGNYGVTIIGGSELQSVDIAITGNVINGCSGGGISTSGTASLVNAAGNTVTGCGTTPILNSGTSRGLSAVGNLTDQGLPTVASGTSIAVPLGIDAILVSGTTTITTISSGSSFPGRRITLIFTGSLTLNGSNNLYLSGGSFATSANSTLSLIADALGFWYEVGRKT
jgi:Right handed beta helix region